METVSINLSTKTETKAKSYSGLELKLLHVLKDGPMTRDQLVKKLQAPRTTIYDGLKKLIDKMEITKYPFYREDRKRGRPKILFSLLED